MNDPKVLDLYTDMLLFQRDTSREVLIFPAHLEPQERRTVHTLAHHMGLAHTSRGTGDQRQVHIYRVAPGSNVSPPALSGAFPSDEGLRQTLGRSSTGDIAHDRYQAPAYNNNNTILRGQSSVGLLDVDGGYGRNADSNLRNAKSFADLRTWSPSPGAAGFPAALQDNGARLQRQQQQGMNDTNGSNTPTLGPGGDQSRPRDEPSFLISGMNSMNISNGANTSPRRQRSLFGASEWNDSTNNYQSAGPIGSKRAVSMGPNNQEPIRQSRGPGSNNAIGFRRMNGRGDSDELRKATAAIAE